MRPVYLLISLLLTLMCPAVAGDERKSIVDHPEVRGAVAIVDAWIDGVRDYQEVPGISVGFVVDQQLVYNNSFGYSNLRKKIAADANTIYSICSISKLFTSIGVMQMRDAGKLNLRDPVSEHLDWFDIKQAHATAGPARVLGLITHSSGLPRESDFPYWTGEGFPFPSRESMIEVLEQQQTLYPADSQFQYSNLGLSLAGEIVQKHAGVPYADYIQEAVLQPIGLNDTRPYFPKELHGKQMAIGYSGMARDRKRQAIEPFDTKAITPAAGFTSTVRDLATFASWNFRTLNGDASTVIAPNTLREMQRVHWVNPDWKTTWGLGFTVNEVKGHTVVGHAGGCPGYITSFAMVPRHKIAAIALTNAADGPARNITNGMLSVIGAALQKAAKASTPPAAVPDLSRYEGNYGGGVWGGETAIRQWGKQLASIQLPRTRLGDVTKLKQVEGNTFVRLTKEGEERERLVFQEDSDGEVTGVLRHSNVSRRLREK